MNSHGYRFSVSPDEAWIAVVHQAEPGEGSRVRVLHRRSRKTWEAPLSGWRFDEFPDCFSQDSSQIVLAGKIAELSTSMRNLEFTALPSGAAPVRTFLGFPTRLLGEPGQGRRDWLSVPQAEGEFGHVAWGEDGTKYTSLTEGQVETSVLRITPPGRSYEVDSSALLEAERKRLARAAAKLPRQLADLLKEEGEAPAIVRLKQLSVSPDGKSLAAVATVYRGQVGFAGRPYGVLIPLDRGEYEARPFAVNVYGKIVWSGDSKAVYYYAQPEVGLGNGTVHRLAVAR